MDLKQIEAVLSAPVIYNVDYVEAKTRLNRLIEKAHKVGSELYLKAYIEGGRVDNDTLHDVYYGCPAAHSFKAYARRLPHAVPAAFQPALDAYRAVLTTYKPAAELLAAAKDRVVKARKPSATPRKTPERTIDNTGTCACCGQNVKLNAGRLVAHGYTIRWGFQSGNCFAVGLRPIEVSSEGLTAAIAAYERQQGICRLEIEYGTAKQRGVGRANLHGIEGALKAYRADLAAWAPRALPDGRADHL